MYSKVNYTIVGFFVVLFTIGMVWFGFWLGKYNQPDEYNTYQTYFSESVSGLAKNSTVMLHGITVGYVDDITIDKAHIDKTKVILKIKNDIPITNDMRTTLKMMGITGLLNVEIEGGSNKAEILKPNENNPPIIPSKMSWINETKQMVVTLSSDMKDISNQLKKLLSDSNIEHINSLVSNFDSATIKANQSFDEINNTIEIFNNAIKDIDNNISVALKSFDGIKQDFDTLSKRALPTIDDIQNATKDFQTATNKFIKSLDRGDYNIKRTLQPTLIDIQLLSEQVTDLLNTINQNPNALIFQSRQLKKGPGE
jgi:phospholipid/cholesterol/gamma-HCH transport system substrate-binding protein